MCKSKCSNITISFKCKIFCSSTKKFICNWKARTRLDDKWRYVISSVFAVVWVMQSGLSIRHVFPLFGIQYFLPNCLLSAFKNVAELSQYAMLLILFYLTQSTALYQLNAGFQLFLRSKMSYFSTGGKLLSWLSVNCQGTSMGRIKNYKIPWIQNLFAIDFRLQICMKE